MKECKDMDPARTDRVSVWINKANDLLTMNWYLQRYWDKFQKYIGEMYWQISNIEIGGYSYEQNDGKNNWKKWKSVMWSGKNISSNIGKFMQGDILPARGTGWSKKNGGKKEVLLIKQSVNKESLLGVESGNLGYTNARW